MDESRSALAPVEFTQYIIANARFEQWSDLKRTAVLQTAVDAINGLSNYHLRPSVRGDLLMKLGRSAEAREEFQRAIFLTDNAREKQLLTEKLNRIEKEDRSA